MPGYKTAGTGKNIKGADNSEWYYGKLQIIRDVLVLCSEALVPVSLVRCYPIGVIRMIDGKYDDDKIIAIPYNDPNMNHYKTLDDVPKHMISEIEHFFMVYKNLEHKSTTGFKLEGKKQAIDIINQALQDYQKSKDKLIRKNIRL